MVPESTMLARPRAVRWRVPRVTGALLLLTCLAASLFTSTLGCRKGSTTETASFSDIDLGDLRVTFPGVPERTARELATAAGRGLLTAYNSKLGDSGFAFSFVEYPDATTWDPEASLSGAINNMIAGARARAGTQATVRTTSDNRVAVAGMSARDVNLVVDDGRSRLHCRVLAIAGDKRAYSLIATTPTDNDPVAKKMFTSLRPRTSTSRSGAAASTSQ